MMRTRARNVLPALALLAAARLLVACGDEAANDADASDQLHVVVTHPILGDIVRNVVGGGASVEVIIPSGADPHEFQPSAKQVEAITEADLVVANGFDFETGLLDALDAARDAGSDVFEMASAYTSPRDHDPHIWFDPRQMATAIEALGRRLDALDTDRGWKDRAAAYASEVRATDAEVEATLSVVPPERRKLVTNHEALSYLAARYDFEIVGAAIPSLSTAAESSAATLAALADAIVAQDVPAVFADVSSPDDLARALADEVGSDVEVVELLTETLAEPGEDGDDYLDLLRLDAQRIADALS
jgi:zinc/manganese transport system substrate-binding protein